MTEVVLLGQNVNSFWDKNTLSSLAWKERRDTELGDIEGEQEREGEGEGEGERKRKAYAYSIAPGFTQRTPVVSKGAKKEAEKEIEVRQSQSSTVEKAGGEGEGGGEEEGEGGVRFAELLSLVAAIDPDNMRIRFQSPHPKDFPAEVPYCNITYCKVLYCLLYCNVLFTVLHCIVLYFTVLFCSETYCT
jgi:hypothetical protein